MWQLDTIATFFLSVVGLAFAMCDFLEMWFSLDKKNGSGIDPDYDEELLKCITEMLKTENSNQTILIKDYDVCQSEIVRRDNSTLLIGSIFTTASLLLLANTISQKFQNSMFVYAFASILLYLLWLLLVHKKSKQLDDITYTRIHTIERALANEKSGYQFGHHSYIWRKTHTQGKTKRWLRKRRVFWSVILMLISSAWMILSLSASWQFSTVLILCAVAVIVVFLNVCNYLRLPSKTPKEKLLTTGE
jgi:hypothetical protein